MRFGIAKRLAPRKLEPTFVGPTREVLGVESYKIVEEALGYNFKDKEWLTRAFTHRSASASSSQTDYERLEFIGDAVFDLAVAHLLSEQYPEAKEGELSKMRAALVNTQALSLIAKKIGLGSFIRLGKGEQSSGGADRPSILADVMEGVIGALYKDGGYEPSLQAVQKIYGDELKTVTPRDPKTELQEALHASGSEPPVYMLECMEGPEHAPTFVSIVQVDGQLVGRGRGPTKKASQQEAASDALAKVKPYDEIDQMFLDKNEDSEPKPPQAQAESNKTVEE